MLPDIQEKLFAVCETQYADDPVGDMFVIFKAASLDALVGMDEFTNEFRDEESTIAVFEVTRVATFESSQTWNEVTDGS